jgi:hypothetical protein
MRTRPQEIWDRIVLLHLLEAARIERGVDTPKVQKLMFIALVEGKSKGLRVAHYSFFRHIHGPYSKDLADELLLLEQLGFVNPESRELTDRARQMLDFTLPSIRQSVAARDIFALVDDVCAAYKDLESLPHLVNFVHQMVVPVADWGNDQAAVRDVPLCVYILRPNVVDTMEATLLSERLLRDLDDKFSVSADHLQLENEMARVGHMGQRFGICDTD